MIPAATSHLGRGRWEADGLRDIVREYVVENLATDVAAWSSMRRAPSSRAKHRAVLRVNGSAGKITNCQIGVFAAYVSRSRSCLYEAITFATKPGLAVDMVRRALAADVPFSWVAADAVYGLGEIERALRRVCKAYVLGVEADYHF